MSGALKITKGHAAYHEKITTGSAIGFTSAKIAPTTGVGAGLRAYAALITVETADIRFTLEGTTPVITATDGGVGHVLAKDQSYVIEGYDNVANFKCINAADASGAIVRATYYFLGQ